MTRKNPKKSGGPQTPKGKVASSQNSTKTGAYSSLPLLPNEDPKELKQFLDQFVHEFRPADMTESTLVRDLAVIGWKKIRLERLENDYFIKKSNAPITLEEFVESGLEFNAARFEYWKVSGCPGPEEADKFQKTLDCIKPIFRVGITVDQLLEVKELNGIIYEALVDYYRQTDPLALPEIPDEDLVYMTVSYSKQPERFLTSKFAL